MNRKAKALDTVSRAQIRPRGRCGPSPTANDLPQQSSGRSRHLLGCITNLTLQDAGSISRTINRFRGVERHCDAASYVLLGPLRSVNERFLYLIGD
jgi:hypothetical protein